jgi:hypothetical protein
VLISKKLRIDHLYRTLLNTFVPSPFLDHVCIRPGSSPPPITPLNSSYPLMKVKSIIAFGPKISEAGGMAVVPFPFEQAPAFSRATAVHGSTRWPSCLRRLYMSTGPRRYIADLNDLQMSASYAQAHSQHYHFDGSELSSTTTTSKLHGRLPYILSQRPSSV